MSAPVESKRRFIQAIRSGRMMFAEIAAATGLTVREVMDIWAEGVAAGKLRIGDDAPGFRYIAEVA